MCVYLVPLALITFVRRLWISFEICDITNEDSDPDPFCATELAAVVAAATQPTIVSSFLNGIIYFFFFKVPNIIMVYYIFFHCAKYNNVVQYFFLSVKYNNGI